MKQNKTLNVLMCVVMVFATMVVPSSAAAWGGDGFLLPRRPVRMNRRAVRRANVQSLRAGRGCCASTGGVNSTRSYRTVASTPVAFSDATVVSESVTYGEPVVTTYRLEGCEDGRCRWVQVPEEAPGSPAVSPQASAAPTPAAPEAIYAPADTRALEDRVAALEAKIDAILLKLDDCPCMSRGGEDVPLTYQPPNLSMVSTRTARNISGPMLASL